MNTRCLLVGNKRGFIAFMAAMLIIAGTFIFQYVSFSAVSTFLQVVSKKELRIQARLNSDSCLVVIRKLIQYDPYISGQIKIKDFGCTANVKRLSEEDREIEIKNILEGVSYFQKSIIKI